MLHQRFFCPVGQGGFSIEKIEGFTVVYDCGSLSSFNMVVNCIDHFSFSCFTHVDILYISHFDMDHVNGIRYLLDSVRVSLAVTPMIPQALRVSFNVYTGGAYGAMMELLRQRGRVEEVEEVGEEDSLHPYYSKGKRIWEWIAKSMMDYPELSKVLAHLGTYGFSRNQLNNAELMEQEKERVNDAFKKVFGRKGPNAKGLVVLSQKCKDVVIEKCEVWHGGYCCGQDRQLGEYEESSCLYVGDADLRNIQYRKNLMTFMQTYKSEKMPLFMQIPHHGSPYNTGAHFETDFPAVLYFLNDKDSARLKKKPAFFASLMRQKKLLEVKDVCSDMVITRTVVL